MPALFARIVPLDGERLELRAAQGQGLARFGLTPQTVEGPLARLLGLLHPEDAPRLESAILRALEDEAPHEESVRLGPSDSLRWLRVHLSPRRTGETLTLSALLRDVTEERKLADGIRRAQRRQALGELAAGLAHNFNNMLATILPNLEALRGLGGLASEPLLDDAIRATQQAADLVHQLLFAARGDTELRRDPVNLGPIVEEVVRLCRRTFPVSIVFEVEHRSDRAVTIGHAGHLRQVLLNLCLNARDALAGVEAPRIHIILEEIPGQLHLSRTANETHLALTVRDNGCGIDRATQQRLGEPFFTTKGTRGTGIGLATVFGTVREMGGGLELHSEVGVGTAFTLHLPLDASRQHEAAPPPPVAIVEAVQLAGTTVLFVDDEPLVRRAIQRALERSGLHVLVASEGHEALELLAAHREEVQIVLLDRSMPGMNGDEVMREINRSDPHLPVVILSGDATRHDDLSAAAAVLQKPVARDRLLAALAEATRLSSPGKPRGDH